MTTYVEVDAAGAVEAVAAALESGGAVVLPTDTVYGLATTPAHEARLYELKGRPASIPIAMLVASIEQARALAEFDERAERLADAWWPGPLTIVMPRRPGETTVGVRCPDNAFVRELTARVGPLAVTSANRHGEATPTSAAAAAAALAGPVEVVVDGGSCDGVASTVVDVSGPDLVIVRAGPIAEQNIRATAIR